MLECVPVVGRGGAGSWALKGRGLGSAREPHHPSSPRRPPVQGQGCREPQGPRGAGWPTGPRSRVEAACRVQGRATRVTHPHNNPGTASLRLPTRERKQTLGLAQGHTAGLGLMGPPELPGLGLISWVHWSLEVGDQGYWSTELGFPTCARGGRGQEGRASSPVPSAFP